VYKSFFKRFIDVVLGSIGLVILAIPMLIIALMIKVDSPGPVLFKQQRLGRNGRAFWIYKFRSMGVDAEVIETPVEAEDIAATSLTATPGTVSQNYTVPAAAGGTAQQTLTATFPTVTYSAEPIPSPIKKTAMALKVTSANKSSGGGFKHSKGGGGGGSGGGGGGGGKKKQKKDKIRPQDEIQRYHKNESTLT